MIATLRGANLALAFLLELAMLAGLAVVGWSINEAMWLRETLAVGLPAIAIVLWAWWAAPRSKSRLKQPALLMFKIAIFGATALALWIVGQGSAAGGLAALVAINLCAAAVLQQS